MKLVIEEDAVAICTFDREREEGGVEEVREGVIYYMNSIHPRHRIEI